MAQTSCTWSDSALTSRQVTRTNISIAGAPGLLKDRRQSTPRSRKAMFLARTKQITIGLTIRKPEQMLNCISTWRGNHGCDCQYECLRAFYRKWCLCGEGHRPQAKTGHWEPTLFCQSCTLTHVLNKASHCRHADTHLFPLFVCLYTSFVLVGFSASLILNVQRQI